MRLPLSLHPRIFLYDECVHTSCHRWWLFRLGRLASFDRLAVFVSFFILFFIIETVISSSLWWHFMRVRLMIFILWYASQDMLVGNRMLQNFLECSWRLPQYLHNRNMIYLTEYKTDLMCLHVAMKFTPPLNYLVKRHVSILYEAVVCNRLFTVLLWLTLTVHSQRA